MANTNCLEGIRCPQCGNEEEFRIEALVVCKVTDDGAEATGEFDWHDKSWCLCPKCEKEGDLEEFQVEDEDGQDISEAVRENARERTYRSAKVCIDDPDGGYIVPPTEAWIVANDRWNGWVMPYFAKAEADRVMAAWNASTEGLDPMRYDAAEDRYCVPFGAEVEVYQGEDLEIEGETRRVYGVGACAWTWDLEPEEAR